MITEDYVSFETAKLLKEKGFDEKCISYYNNGNISVYSKVGHTCSNRDLETFGNNCYTAPTLQMAMKWLREVHNIHIIPYFDRIQPTDLPYSFAVYIVDEYIATREIIACFDIDETLYWSKPEQACEAAIKYCLENLI